METGEAFGSEALLPRSVRIEKPGHDLCSAVACRDGRVDALGEAHRGVVDLTGLSFQGGEEVVLRSVEHSLGFDEMAVPLDDLGGVGVRGRRDGNCGPQLIHAHSEVGFDPFGEHTQDIRCVFGYVVGQRELLFGRRHLELQGQGNDGRSNNPAVKYAGYCCVPVS
jgi:hypothetical protein